MKFANSMWFSVLGLVCLCGIACDNATDFAKKSEDAAEVAAKKELEAAKKVAAAVGHLSEEALAKAKEEFAKLNSGHFEAIEQKIKDLAGEKATEAQALFEKAKEKAIAMKDAAPEKFAEMKAEVEKLVAQLKEKVGL